MLSNYTKIPSGDLQSLRTAIATNGPVAVAIDASHKSFSFYGYGVYYEEACGEYLHMQGLLQLLVGNLFYIGQVTRKMILITQY